MKRETLSTWNTGMWNIFLRLNRTILFQLLKPASPFHHLEVSFSVSAIYRATIITAEHSRATSCYGSFLWKRLMTILAFASPGHFLTPPLRLFMHFRTACLRSLAVFEGIEAMHYFHHLRVWMLA